MNVPKCLVRVAGKRIIEHQLELLRDVPDVRIVVGFREEAVIDCVRAFRPDTIFVRNPRYASTSTLQSIALAARHLPGPFLALDGDLLLEPVSFDRFLAACAAGPPVLAIAPAHSEDAVYVTTAEGRDGTLSVTGFRRHPHTDMEWTGLAYLDPFYTPDHNSFVYEALTPHLPMRASVVRALEVDTAGDLDRANRRMRNSDWSRAIERDLEPLLTRR
jgi:choline kinase